MTWEVVPYTRQHDRTGFDCSKEPLNRFLHQQVTQYEKRNLGRTYVLVEPGQTRVLGYYTLAASQVSLDDLPEDQAKKLSRHPVPVILLGRLAVDQSLQGQGAGKMLLHDALQRCVSVAEQIGSFAVFVEAIDDEAAKFYQRYGFQPFREQPLKLFLSISTLQQGS
jgi:GNAT superfamily N-acetyltransferase